jgi:hypothetical protein
LTPHNKSERREKSCSKDYNKRDDWKTEYTFSIAHEPSQVRERIEERLGIVKVGRANRRQKISLGGKMKKVSIALIALLLLIVGTVSPASAKHHHRHRHPHPHPHYQHG